MEPEKSRMTVPMLVHLKRLEHGNRYIVTRIVDNRTDSQRDSFVWPALYDVITEEDIQNHRWHGCKFLIEGEKE